MMLVVVVVGWPKGCCHRLWICGRAGETLQKPLLVVAAIRWPLGAPLLRTKVPPAPVCNEHLLREPVLDLTDRLVPFGRPSRLVAQVLVAALLSGIVGGRGITV